MHNSTVPQLSLGTLGLCDLKLYAHKRLGTFGYLMDDSTLPQLNLGTVGLEPGKLGYLRDDSTLP